jgi:hypothetical protein
VHGLLGEEKQHGVANVASARSAAAWAAEAAESVAAVRAKGGMEAVATKAAEMCSGIAAVTVMVMHERPLSIEPISDDISVTIASYSTDGCGPSRGFASSSAFEAVYSPRWRSLGHLP